MKTFVADLMTLIVSRDKNAIMQLYARNVEAEFIGHNVIWRNASHMNRIIDNIMQFIRTKRFFSKN